jgi:hypothetical protein
MALFGSTLSEVERLAHDAVSGGKDSRDAWRKKENRGSGIQGIECGIEGATANLQKPPDRVRNRLVWCAGPRSETDVELAIGQPATRDDRLLCEARKVTDLLPGENLTRVADVVGSTLLKRDSQQMACV